VLEAYGPNSSASDADSVLSEIEAERNESEDEARVLYSTNDNK
jgi:hypothetical protein